jgi:hypothetical protein
MLGALERQDLSCTYLAHHESNNVHIIIVIVTFVVNYILHAEGTACGSGEEDAPAET